jgi:hypothetical protein
MHGSMNAPSPPKTLSVMKYPTRQTFKRFFGHLPRWVVPLILLLLFGRFLLLFFMHL